MEAVNLSQVGQTNFTNKQEVQKETSKALEQKKNGKKLLVAGAAAVATIVVAGLAMKGKIGKAKEVAQDGILKLQDVKFFHGEAYSKADGKAFSGIISDILKNGDTIEMVYKDGILQKSERKGAKNVLKTFKYFKENDGTISKRINTSTQGKVREARYCYHSNGILDEFKVWENDNKIIDVKQNSYGALEWIKKGNHIRFFDPDGKISSEYLANGDEKHWNNTGELISSKMRREVIAPSGRKMDVTIEFEKDKIAKIHCDDDFIYNEDDNLIISSSSDITPSEVTYILDRLGIDNSLRIKRDNY